MLSPTTLSSNSNQSINNKYNNGIENPVLGALLMFKSVAVYPSVFMKCEVYPTMYSLSRSFFISSIITHCYRHFHHHYHLKLLPIITNIIITIEWNTMEEAYHTAHQQVNQEFARLLLNLIHHEGRNV